MKIKIDSKNKVKIEEALKAVNGSAESFTITSYDQIADLAIRFEKCLSVLPACRRKGARGDYVPEGPYANRYKYSSVSTSVILQRGVSDWFLTYVDRCHLFPKEKEFFSIGLSSAQIEEIKRKAVEGFYPLPEETETAKTSESTEG